MRMLLCSSQSFEMAIEYCVAFCLSHEYPLGSRALRRLFLHMCGHQFNKKPACRKSLGPSVFREGITEIGREREVDSGTWGFWFCVALG